MSANIVRRGACHVFGDDLPLDEGVIPFKYAIGRVTDPALLIPHLFELIDPGFRERVNRGDIVFAGKNFGCGKAHMQGFIAMAALDIGVLCGSMPHRALRGAVAKGVPLLTGCSAEGFAQSGDEIEISFTSGDAINHTTGARTAFPALAPVLNDILNEGGLMGTLRSWLEKHPAMKGSAPGRGTDWLDRSTVTFMPKEKA